MRYLLLSLFVCFLTNCGTDANPQDQERASTTVTDQSQLTTTSAQFVKQKINPPIDAVKIPDESHTISATAGGRIELHSGTIIEIPAHAFVYPDAQAVTGDVQIEVREFRTAAEVILSGIPMRDWDDSEQAWKNFSTAGMFEITGTDAAQQTIQIAEGHPLTVHFASEVDGTYDYWYFDEAKGDWENQGQNTAEAFTPTGNSSAAATASTTTADNIPPRPAAPRKYDTDKLRITFTGMNLVDFPELNDPDNVALQYAGKAKAAADPQENQWVFAEDWYKAELTRTGKGGVYQLYLENDDKDFTTYVHPTLLPKAYAAALADYRQKVADYERATRNRDKNRIRMERLRRSMQVNRFGVYNYDVYGRWEEPVFAAANFQLEADQTDESTLARIYLITDDGRISVRYPRSDWKRFNFDRSRNNLLLGITKDDRIVMVSPENFTEQSANLVVNEAPQAWNCVVDGVGTAVENSAGLQALINNYFAG